MEFRYVSFLKTLSVFLSEKGFKMNESSSSSNLKFDTASCSSVTVNFAKVDVHYASLLSFAFSSVRFMSIALISRV